VKTILQAVQAVLEEVPDHVTVVAAAKQRSPAEIDAVARAGIPHIGQNYVQEAADLKRDVTEDVSWRMIGHLQRNKARQAVALFDWIDSIDSLRLARRVDRFCAEMGKVMPVLLEINSGREANKTGFFPEKIDAVLPELAALSHLKIHGLMTMGPRFGNPEDSRPYFVETRRIFERIAASPPAGVEMSILSMGMSNSYRVAIEEGATMIRLGTALFGSRKG